MTVFLDTNVLIDVIVGREPFLDDSKAVLTLCFSGAVEGWVSDLTFCNIAYIMRKQFGAEALREKLRYLKSGLFVCPVGEAAISLAIDNFTTDFEDEVQMLAADAANVDYIVTRNKEHFGASRIPVYTPSEFRAFYSSK